MNTTSQRIIPTVLSIVGCAGVVTTSYFAATGHLRARDILDKHEIPEDTPPREAFEEAARLTWKEYAPAVISGALTILCICESNHLHLKTEAALAAVVGVIGARLKGMDKEVLKKYGKQALDEMRHDILKKEVNERTEKLRKVEKKKHDVDEGVFYEPFTEQFFWASTEEIKNAELQLNSTFQSEGSVTLADFIKMLPKKANLVVPDWAGQMGWYAGDENFEYNAAFTSGYISLNPVNSEVNGWQAAVIQYSIYPAEPGEDYIDIVKGNKVPYSFYHAMPGSQSDLRTIDFSKGITNLDHLYEKAKKDIPGLTYDDIYAEMGVDMNSTDPDDYREAEAEWYKIHGYLAA